MTCNRTSRKSWGTVGWLALALVAFIACGDDVLGNGDDNGNGEAQDVAAIKIGGSAKDSIPRNVFVGFPVILTAVPQDEDGNDIESGSEEVVEVLNGIEWSSSDESVASVEVKDYGQASSNATAEVTTNAPGTVTITAAYQDMTDSITLTVTALGG